MQRLNPKTGPQLREERSVRPDKLLAIGAPKAFLSSRSMWKGYYYAKGARRSTGGERSATGMGWNWYRCFHATTPLSERIIDKPGISTPKQMKGSETGKRPKAAIAEGTATPSHTPQRNETRSCGKRRRGEAPGHDIEGSSAPSGSKKPREDAVVAEVKVDSGRARASADTVFPSIFPLQEQWEYLRIEFQDKPKDDSGRGASAPPQDDTRDVDCIAPAAPVEKEDARAKKAPIRKRGRTRAEKTQSPKIAEEAKVPPMGSRPPKGKRAKPVKSQTRSQTISTAPQERMQTIKPPKSRGVSARRSGPTVSSAEKKSVQLKVTVADDALPKE
jgi:hypothetical protein